MQPATVSSAAPTHGEKPIPLHAGDHLSAGEFLRRYEAAGDQVQAELINGIVYIMSPAHFEAHGKPDSIIAMWLSYYAAFTPSVEHATGPTVKLSRLDVPQPDSLLLLKPEAGGSCRITPDDYISGAPELVAEIAATSASYDLREKLQAYLRAGVREYLVWRTYDEAVDWFVLREDDFARVEPDAEGILRSPHLSGLWLNTKALLGHDRPAILRTLEEGLKARAPQPPK